MLASTWSLLAGYTFSCHSCRHLCGGHLDSFSKAPVALPPLARSSPGSTSGTRLFAWISLFGVALTDLYIRLVVDGRSSAT